MLGRTLKSIMLHAMIKETASRHAILQGYIDCFFDAAHQKTLKEWADSGWKIQDDEEYDESCLKYIALVVLDAYAHGAQKILFERGCPALIATSDRTYMLPPAPEALLARGLEILREICGMRGAQAQGALVLGIGDQSREITIVKNKRLHVMML